MKQLVINFLAGKSLDAWQGNKFSDLGHEREPESRAFYELLTDNNVDEVGFVYKDEKKLVGCSPDGLVDGGGCVEFKNPKASTMPDYLLSDDMPTCYKVQVQAQMWITGSDWCDFMVYNPDLMAVHAAYGHKLFHVKRDEQFITTMSGMVNKFIAEMLAKRNKMMELLEKKS